MKAFRSFFHHVFARLGRWFGGVWQAIRPGVYSTRGAAIGVLLISGLTYFAFAISLVKGPLAPGLMIVNVATCLSSRTPAPLGRAGSPIRSTSTATARPATGCWQAWTRASI